MQVTSKTSVRVLAALLGLVLNLELLGGLGDAHGEPP